MPRPKCCRRIITYPDYWRFSADDTESSAERTLFTLDEYEVIRLIDKEGLTQEACARQMDVARTTVTAIYAEARKKLALLLVDGKPLTISGGAYRLSETKNTRLLNKKGNNQMRIAVTYENGHVFPHFGHTEHFKLFDVEDGKIAKEQILETEGSGHGALVGLLKKSGVDALICGGIGGGAKNALSEAGIRFYPGVSGSADKAAQHLVEGTLQYNADLECRHHHGEDHDHGQCGHHREGHDQETCGHHGREHDHRTCGHHGE